jgi:serine protease Do
MLGIMVESIQYEYAILYKDQAGITVTQVNPGSCAEQAGVQVGDKITHFNGVEVWCNAQLNFQKEKYKIGDTVTITVEREGESIELTVILAGAN